MNSKLHLYEKDISRVQIYSIREISSGIGEIGEFDKYFNLLTQHKEGNE